MQVRATIFEPLQGGIYLGVLMTNKFLRTLLQDLWPWIKSSHQSNKVHVHENLTYKIIKKGNKYKEYCSN